MKKAMAFCAVLAILAGCAFGPAGVPITVKNSSFETPAIGGQGAETTDWVAGGTWYGRHYSPDWAPHGEWFVWSSFKRGGADNGYSQELDAVYEAGTYLLTVWIYGDAEGLVSRIMLGYDSGGDNYVVLANSEMGGLGPDKAWKRQTVSVDMTSGSPAVGKPIWIRLTGIAEPTSGDGGDSNSWDNVSLLYYEPAGTL